MLVGVQNTLCCVCVCVLCLCGCCVDKKVVSSALELVCVGPVFLFLCVGWLGANEREWGGTISWSGLCTLARRRTDSILRHLELSPTLNDFENPTNDVCTSINHAVYTFSTTKSAPKPVKEESKNKNENIWNQEQTKSGREI